MLVFYTGITFLQRVVTKKKADPKAVSRRQLQELQKGSFLTALVSWIDAGESPVFMREPIKKRDVGPKWLLSCKKDQFCSVKAHWLAKFSFCVMA